MFQMHASTRLQLVSDALELGRLGRAPYQHVLQLANQLARDSSPLVWRAARPHLLRIERQLRGKRDSLNFKVRTTSGTAHHPGAPGSRSSLLNSVNLI